jgi:DNA polymerase theta
MLEDQTLGLLSCLVVDELHMVGEEERGYQLELLLTKLRWGGCGWVAWMVFAGWADGWVGG